MQIVQKYESVIGLAARYNTNPEIIKLLIRAGANVNVEYHPDGLSTLMIAARYNCNSDVVVALIDAGANIKLRCYNKKTAFDYIQENEKLKNTQAYELLKTLSSDQEHNAPAK